MTGDKALVLFSGGQDSTICLFWAKREFSEVHAITFDYMQRHCTKELAAADRIAQIAGVEHRVLWIPTIKEIGDSTLVGEGSVSEKREGTDLPSSFVPGRNIIFLTFAAMWAYKLKINNLVIGASQADFSGYPDCRQDFIYVMNKALWEGMGNRELEIHTPLMNLTKWQEVKLAKTLLGCWEALAYSHTCYEGEFPPCRKCPACLLRAKGFKEAGEVDPLLMRKE